MSTCGRFAATRGTCSKRVRLRARSVHARKLRRAADSRRLNGELANRQGLRDRPLSRGARAVDDCSLQVLRKRGL